MQSGNHTKDDPRQHGDACRDHEDATVDMGMNKLRKPVGPERYQQAQGSSSNNDRRHASCGRKDQALCEKLAHDSPSASAERRPNGEFALSGCPAREQEVCDVRACDEEQQANRACKEEE
jgi:hypothetical protein